MVGIVHIVYIIEQTVDLPVFVETDEQFYISCFLAISLLNAFADNWNIYGAGHSFCNILPSALRKEKLSEQTFWVSYSAKVIKMDESKMEINIINIEDRHQEKAYAIWKAGTSKTIRYGHFSKRTFWSFPRTRTLDSGIRFLKSLKGWYLWKSSGYSSYKSSQVISFYEHCTKMFDVTPISNHNFRFKIWKWPWNDISVKRNQFW